MYVLVIVSSIQTNRAGCALYKKILVLLEESVSGVRNGRANINLTRSPTANVRKVSRLLK